MSIEIEVKSNISKKQQPNSNKYIGFEKDSGQLSSL